RGPVLAASVIFLLLVGGIVGTTLGLLQARESEEHAQEEAVKAGRERDLADKASAKAIEHAEETRRQLANSHVMLADAAWREGAAALAQDRLDEVPVDLRCWEWHYLKRISAGSLFTLIGHTYWVNSVCFSPDGQRLATASGDQTVKVWDARTGQELLTIKG